MSFFNHENGMGGRRALESTMCVVCDVRILYNNILAIGGNAMNSNPMITPWSVYGGVGVPNCNPGKNDIFP